jgi:mRNA interferase RelE/StbE
MAYTVLLKPSADRALSKLPEPVQRRIAVKLRALQENPRPPGAEKLQGGEELYRVRVGDYRIVYAIEDRRLVVWVVRIADRKDVYRR